MDEREHTMPEDSTEKKTEQEHEDIMNMEDSLAYAPMEDVHPGDIVEGKVVHISNEGVLVDVGAKSEGIIHINDLSHRRIERPEDVVKLGDVISVYVLGYEGEEGALKLSKKRADEQEAWKALETAKESGEILHAPVVEVVKGGLVVDVGLRGFIPASHIARGYVSDMSPYLGQVVPLKVVELDRGKRRAILSRKIAMEIEESAKKEQLWQTIEEGQVRHGVVKSLTDFGAFIDLGGVDGLLHISEMSWGRINHPSEVLEVGQEIDVKVLRLDPEKNKISLGLRQVLPNPWENAGERYHEGQLYEGTVVRLAGFGAFVELEPGVDGLIHISQLAPQRIHQPSDVVAVGDRIWVKILSVDAVNKRISLSKRQADDDIANGALTQNQEHVDEDSGSDTIGEHLNAYHAGNWDDENPPS
ncbi:MAG: 30S ribosomal protein S1 [Firmicutes bacterium]|jgi:4-hydroxy-3-methylbut-2-enyl diphosphate reductase|nr:30S ribosomal protein S1 [Bacillota bacterium]MCL5015783.1 30S ribosomal protein S1 [Bacillota bacterium]